MAHLDSEYLVSVHVHTSINVAGVEVVRVWHTMCFDPADSEWISK